MLMIVTLSLASAIGATCNLAIANDFSQGRNELISPGRGPDLVQQRQPPASEENIEAVQMQNLISQRQQTLKLLQNLPGAKQGRDCTICKNMGN